MKRWRENPRRMYPVMNKVRAETEGRFGPTLLLLRWVLARVHASGLARIAVVHGSDKGVVNHGYGGADLEGNSCDR